MDTAAEPLLEPEPRPARDADGSPDSGSHVASPPGATGTTRGALVPAVLVAASAVVVFGFEQRLVGFAVLAAALVVSAFLSRKLLRDLALVAVGLVIMGLVPVNTEISNEHMLVMGTAMVLAIAIPYSVSRWVYGDHAVRFPWRAGRWTRFEKIWVMAVVVIGYLVLPVYLIRSEVYQNWPAVSDPEGIGRLFVGTNVLGIWDELFFICTCFTLLRRHLPDWQANLVQAVLFTSFLWELGFHSIGPLLIYPFALIQGYTFKVTRSLTYVVTVHLLFDLVLFGVLVHAHNRHWVDIFLY